MSFFDGEIKKKGGAWSERKKVACNNLVDFYYTRGINKLDVISHTPSRPLFWVL